jgi:hypothetical protein
MTAHQTHDPLPKACLEHPRVQQPEDSTEDVMRRRSVREFQIFLEPSFVVFSPLVPVWLVTFSRHGLGNLRDPSPKETKTLQKAYKTARSASTFLKTSPWPPVHIQKILTDNGKEFTDRLLCRDKPTNTCPRPPSTAKPLWTP